MATVSSPLEAVLHRDRAIVVSVLVLLTTIAWIYLALTASGMARGDMRLMGIGVSMGGMHGAMSMSAQPWTVTTFLLMLVMWWVMMVGMMIPSAAPMILIYARVQRKKLPDENPLLRCILFTLGYVLMWLGFSVVATLAQWRLGEATLLSPAMASTSVYLGVTVFAVAGLYQLTPLKQACLVNCRSPVQFLTEHRHPGNTGAAWMGIHHGLFCLGCCWFLMALLFVGGVMNLYWIVGIATYVAVEKVLPAGQRVAKIMGAVLMVWGVGLLVSQFIG